MRKIYVATSWKNERFEEVIKQLEKVGHEVYNFRSPSRDMTCTPTSLDGGFSWADIDPNWKNWTPEKYRDNLLNNELAAHGFTSDFRGMRWADTCLLILPSGRSAHVEAGFMSGANKKVIVLLEDKEIQPDLMYLLFDHICINMREVLSQLKMEV